MRIHDRMSVMVRAELPDAEASRRSSPVKVDRRPRRLAQDARALTGETGVIGWIGQAGPSSSFILPLSLIE